MGKKHFSEEQIAIALRQAELGTAGTEIVRKLGVSEQTFFYVLLRREGWLVNKKLVYRLYCEEGLGIRRRKPRRRRSVQVREARSATERVNES